jgi:hypothetical protein
MGGRWRGGQGDRHRAIVTPSTRRLRRYFAQPPLKPPSQQHVARRSLWPAWTDSSSPVLPIAARERERERVFFAEASMGAAVFCLLPDGRTTFIRCRPRPQGGARAGRYSSAINARLRVTDHLFQARFGSVAMDEGVPDGGGALCGPRFIRRLGAISENSARLRGTAARTVSASTPRIR